MEVNMSQHMKATLKVLGRPHIVPAIEAAHLVTNSPSVVPAMIPTH